MCAVGLVQAVFGGFPQGLPTPRVEGCRPERAAGQVIDGIGVGNGFRQSGPGQRCRHLVGGTPSTKRSPLGEGMGRARGSASAATKPP